MNATELTFPHSFVIPPLGGRDKQVKRKGGLPNPDPNTESVRAARGKDRKERRRGGERNSSRLKLGNSAGERAKEGEVRTGQNREGEMGLDGTYLQRTEKPLCSWLVPTGRAPRGRSGARCGGWL